MAWLAAAHAHPCSSLHSPFHAHPCSSLHSPFHAHPSSSLHSPFHAHPSSSLHSPFHAHPCSSLHSPFHVHPPPPPPRTSKSTCSCDASQPGPFLPPASSLIKQWTASALAVVIVGMGGHARADLNKFEAEIRGEFGVGSAAQYGSADLRKTVHRNENFRRANFTSADMREADFSGSTFNGAYLEKAVAYKTNFEDADLSDTLMDRMVLNDANLKNAILVRAVLTRSDLGNAIIEGADFSDAVIDLPQKQALCRYAGGMNEVTGMSTRTSLGCSNARRSAYGTPSAPVLSAPPVKLLDRDGYCDGSTGLCDMSPTK